MTRLPQRAPLTHCPMLLPSGQVGIAQAQHLRNQAMRFVSVFFIQELSRWLSDVRRTSRVPKAAQRGGDPDFRPSYLLSDPFILSGFMTPAVCAGETPADSDEKDPAASCRNRSGITWVTWGCINRVTPGSRQAPWGACDWNSNPHASQMKANRENRQKSRLYVPIECLA
jgi:hypothetical protein